MHHLWLPFHSILWSGSTSKVTNVWLYRNSIIIIIIGRPALRPRHSFWAQCAALMDLRDRFMVMSH